MKDLYITFNVSGSIRQRVEVADDMTPQQLQAMFDKSEIVTTIQEGGELLLTSDFETKVGTVEDVDCDCEYSEYEVEGTDEEENAS
jgi:hypothetical protein